MKKIAVFVLALAILFAGCVEEKEVLPLENETMQTGINPNITDEIAPKITEPCADKDAMEKAFCYSDLAIEKNDLSVCSQIVVGNNSQQQQLNIDFCIAKFAFFKHDVEICEGIETGTLRDACVMDLAMYLEDSSMCEKVTDEENKYVNCYIAMAENKNDSQICGEIGDANYSAFCSSMILKDPKFCDEINDTYLADSCYLQAVWDTQKWEQCKKITDEMTHDICLAMIASQLQDESICDNVKIEENFQNCQNEVASPSFPNG